MGAEMKTLVVGAAGTIGRACVTQQLALGNQVVAADVVNPQLADTENYVLDVSNLNSVFELVSEVEKTGPITGLIYAAGVNFTGNVDKTDWDQFHKLMQVNLQGAFHTAAALQSTARLRARTFSCVFISSTAGLKGEAGGSVYVATKFGLIGFTQSFAAEVAELGGRANAVCPGNVDSPMLRRLAAQIGEREGREADEMLAEFASSSKFNRLITPDEVAATCSWLLSAQSSGISGQVIVVDGAA
jgi:NAD(P)-dependent dehydrogenase (short-subunit alcohol dehydrogenase family)